MDHKTQLDQDRIAALEQLLVQAVSDLKNLTTAQQIEHTARKHHTRQDEDTYLGAHPRTPVLAQHYTTTNPNVPHTPKFSLNQPNFTNLSDPQRKVYCIIHKRMEPLSDCVLVHQRAHPPEFVCKDAVELYGLAEYIVP